MQQSSDRILSGAEAEDVEDELGTSGIPDICRQAGTSSHVAGARGPHRGGSGSSIAEMLREVEAYVGNWRSRGTNGAVAQQCATGVDVEDPMADYKAYVSVARIQSNQGLLSYVVTWPAVPPCPSILSCDMIL